ncbi:MAG: hypothetical protein HC805_05300, partial [Alkalinema sp. RL_2_19]|nr:hypothetical protein [Alkalinema sp. RL_2_19]
TISAFINSDRSQFQRQCKQWLKRRSSWWEALLWLIFTLFAELRYIDANSETLLLESLPS